MSIQRKPSKFEQTIILSPIRAYIKSKYNISVEKNETEGLKGPYLILSNHVNNWDPLFINCFVSEPLCFVAAAPLFRNKMLKKVLDYAGAISKTKLKNDMGTIRNMITAKKHNRSIALFPEGNRNWNGHADHSIYATAKLVKLLNIPVVIAKIKGGYLSNPRWADSVRKGKVTVSFEKLWDAEQIKDLSTETIHEQLNQALSFDEIAWSEENKIEFHGKGLANYLERYLFTCPNCKKIGAMHSDHDIFSCKACQYKVKYNAFGSLDAMSEQLHFKYLKDWNEWQLNHIAEQAHTQNFKNQLIIDMEDEVELLISDDNAPYVKYGVSKLSWADDAIHVKNDAANIELTIPFNELEALNVHMHNKLDFFNGNKLIRLNFHNPRSSAYKWQKIIYLYQKNKEEQDA